MKLISIVVPAYNENECITALVDSISEVFKPLNYNYELVIVDDGSKDNTFNIIRQNAQSNSSVKGIRLSRNMGHQAALDCGLKHASGDAIISMDADLQHPPSLIPKMIELWEEGYEVITTQKLENEEASFMYKLFSKSFYSLFNKYSQIKLTPNGSDFRLMSRRSLDAVLSMPEYHRFYRGLVPFVGFKTTSIAFDVQKRHAGKRKYNFKQSMRLASDGLFSFSDFALKIPFYLGGIVFIVMLGYLLFTLIDYAFLGGMFVRGWTSVIIILTISISLQLMFMGVMGVYIGKIFFEVKRRPVYFTSEKVGNFVAEQKQYPDSSDVLIKEVV
jgi:dolichol-phosphate mannosyltransferase